MELTGFKPLSICPDKFCRESQHSCVHDEYGVSAANGLPGSNQIIASWPTGRLVFVPPKLKGLQKTEPDHNLTSQNTGGLRSWTRWHRYTFQGAPLYWLANPMSNNDGTLFWPQQFCSQGNENFFLNCLGLKRVCVQHNLQAIPLMLLASSVNTPIHNSRFHLHLPIVPCRLIQCGLGLRQKRDPCDWHPVRPKIYIAAAEQKYRNKAMATSTLSQRKGRAPSPMTWYQDRGRGVWGQEVGMGGGSCMMTTTTRTTRTWLYLDVPACRRARPKMGSKAKIVLIIPVPQAGWSCRTPLIVENAAEPL